MTLVVILGKGSEIYSYLAETTLAVVLERCGATYTRRTT